MSARGRVKSGCGPRSGSRAAESSPICSNRAYATGIDARTDVGKLSLHSKLIVVLLIGISLSQQGWELPAAISWGEIWSLS